MPCGWFLRWLQGRSSPWVPGKFPHFEEPLEMGVEMTAVDFAIRCLVQWSGSGLLNCKWSTQRFYDAFNQERGFLVLSYDIVWRFNQINVNLSSLREACSCFAGSSVFARAEFGNLAGWDLLVSLLQNQTKFWQFGSVWQRYNWLCYWMIRIKHRHQLWSIQQVPVQWFKYVCMMFAKACANIGDAGSAFIAGALQRPFDPFVDVESFDGKSTNSPTAMENRL